MPLESAAPAPIKPVPLSAVEPVVPSSYETAAEEYSESIFSPDPMDAAEDFAEELHQNIMQASLRQQQRREMGSDVDSHGSHQSRRTSRDSGMEEETARLTPRPSGSGTMRSYLTQLRDTYTHHDVEEHPTVTASAMPTPQKERSATPRELPESHSPEYHGK